MFQGLLRNYIKLDNVNINKCIYEHISLIKAYLTSNLAIKLSELYITRFPISWPALEIERNEERQGGVELQQSGKKTALKSGKKKFNLG